MPAKKSAKTAAKKVASAEPEAPVASGDLAGAGEVTTQPPAAQKVGSSEDIPPAQGPIAQTEDKPAVGDADVAPLAAKKVGKVRESAPTTPAPAGKEVVKLTVEEAVAELLEDLFGDVKIVEGYTGAVCKALAENRLVTVTKPADQLVLKIHQDLYYIHRDTVRAVVAEQGDALVAIVNQKVAKMATA